MTERIGYEVGVPCWVDTWRSNADAAVRFYTRLFGWEADGAEGATAYFTCTLRRRAVAGIGRGRAPAGAAAWTTYVWGGECGRDGGEGPRGRRPRRPPSDNRIRSSPAPEPRRPVA
jgi:catechol 2,3-dioxygenase-like lactoylglutathione lyase family enzyme